MWEYLISFIYASSTHPISDIKTEAEMGNSKKDEGWPGEYFGKFQSSGNLWREIPNFQ